MTTKSFALALAAALTATAASAKLSNDELSLNPEVQAAQLETLIHEEFEELGPQISSTMVEIAGCESELQHLDENGQLVKNPQSSASGVFQVLLYTHGKEVARLGLDYDLTEVTDQVRYARFLVEDNLESGLDPFLDWDPSRPCWS